MKVFVNTVNGLLYQLIRAKIYFIVGFHINTLPYFSKLFFKKIFSKCRNFRLAGIIWLHTIRIKDDIQSTDYTGLYRTQFLTQINGACFLIIEVLFCQFSFLYIAIADKLLMDLASQFTIDFYFVTF